MSGPTPTARGAARRRTNLERAVEYSRALVGALPDATVLLVGRDEQVWVAEGALIERYLDVSGSPAGRPLEDYLPGSEGEAVLCYYRRALEGEREDFDYRTRDGRTLWLQLTPLYFGEDTPVAVVAVIQDLTERHRLVAELEAEQARRRMAEEIAGIVHWRLEFRDGEGTVTAMSGSVSGTQPAPGTVEDLLRFVAEGDRERVRRCIELIREEGEGELEADLQGPEGTVRRALIRGRRLSGSAGHVTVLGAVIDITELRAAERARDESAALLGEGFEASPIGMAVSSRDGRYLRVNDAFCRLLGRSPDELVGLGVADVTHSEDVPFDRAGREDIVSGVRGEFSYEKRYIRGDGSLVWATVHVVPVLGHDGSVTGFLSQMLDRTAAREREEQMRRQAEDRAQIASIRSAMAEDRMLLYGQPIIDVGTGATVAHELLVRMCDEDGEIVPPAGFLPVAERYGLIIEIDRWVTERAVELAAAGKSVEVNLSAASFGDAETLAMIRAALTRTGADPSRIVFEVTETAVMADVRQGRAFAAALRELGCRFALDDFGTGYGTFTYLRHLPVDHLKIDVEFVRDLSRNKADERLVHAIVAMARDLGKTTIAEGVEDAETLVRLRELGVEHAQGYHLGRPAQVWPAPSG